MLGKLFIHFLSVLVVLKLAHLSRTFQQHCNSCTRIEFNVKDGVPDKIFPADRVYEMKAVQSITECFVECSLDCRCMSFSVCGMSCHLNSGNQNLTRSPLVHKPGCRYYDFPSPKSTCLNSPSRPPICCLPSPILCFNGGTCSVDDSDTTRRFKCQCTDGYYGRQCNIWKPKTCLDYWTDQVKPLSGKYGVVDPNGASYEVFCDFDSEDDMAWTLFQSFDIANETALSDKSLVEDLPLNEHNLNWELFRLPKSMMSSIASHSTFWRATCSYATYGVDFRDYLRVRLSIMNPLSFTKYYSNMKSNPCITVDYLDIKGKNCEGCTQSFLQHSTNALHIKPKQSRVETKCSFDSSGVEYKCSKGGFYTHILGRYSNNCLDPNYRCTLNMMSTSEFWFGAKIRN